MVKVTLRNKPISKGRLSLYLDYYPPIQNPNTGKPVRREYLKMYILEKARTALEKQDNKEILKQAEMIRQRKQVEINKPEIYSPEELERLKARELLEGDFLEYYVKQQNKRTGRTYYNWSNAYNHIKTFAGSNVKFKDITEPFMNGFKDHLLNDSTLGNNTKNLYFNVFKTSVKQAFEDGILKGDISRKIKNIKTQEAQREYLTLDELKRLRDTPCSNDTVRNASLFAALTGLRISDIEELTWEEVKETKDGYHLDFRQKKTKAIEVMPISNQAYSLLGKRGTGKVFNQVRNLVHQTDILKNWIKGAGITKNITFHSFRHTFATLQLTLGTDIYTVSKMLGHRDLKTTQIYAKVVDEKKREASNKIQLD